jgi:hypothetical protein
MTRRIGQRLRTVDEPTCRQLTRLRQHLRTTVPLVCRVITQGDFAGGFGVKGCPTRADSVDKGDTAPIWLHRAARPRSSSTPGT